MESMGLNQKFWKNKKVLVTGHTGFKGSWLVLLLKELEANVMGISLAPDNLSMFNTLNLENYCTSHLIDLRNKESVSDVFKAFNPDIVFHLASQSLVIKSYNDPYLTYSSNLIGLVNLLDSCRNSNGVRTIINITSDKCYKNNESVKGYKETDQLGGHDPYSNSKACSELITESYRESFFKFMSIACISARAGNVIGGGDWSENRLIPDIIKAFSAKSKLNIRSPEAIRPWQHVLEPLTGYMLLAEKSYDEPELFSEGWNFGPDEDNMRTVNEIISSMSKYINISDIIEYVQSQYHETQILKLDINKAKTKLNWFPKWGFDKTIEMTASWYQEYLSGNNIDKLTSSQITEYLQK